MKSLRLIITLVLFSSLLLGCGSGSNSQSQEKIDPQQITAAVTGLFDAINRGDEQAVMHYLGQSAVVTKPVADLLIKTLQNNIKVSEIKDVKLTGTKASAMVNVEIIPLKIKKDIPLTFDVADTVKLVNPTDLLNLLK